MALTLASITIYPIKSLRGIDVPASPVLSCGLRFDRRYMLVSEDGGSITQREVPGMALIEVTLEPDGLVCDHPALPLLFLPHEPTGGMQTTVTLWRDTIQAQHISQEADRWFSAALDRPCHLVYMPASTRRIVDQHYAPPDQIVGFADGFPFLIANSASLDDLNQRLAQPVTLRRFRPNLVIAGAAPFAEDHWRSIEVGEVTFDLVKPCARCAITTVDPESGTVGKEPLRTLATYRTVDHKVLFAVNALTRGEGAIAVGDAVRVQAE